MVNEVRLPSEALRHIKLVKRIIEMHLGTFTISDDFKLYNLYKTFVGILADIRQ